MSISGAMNTGISGLTTNGEAINVIGNNMANVNTIGFKGGRSLFSDILSQSIGAGQVGRGSQVQAIQNDFTQGAFEGTSSGTDLAIQGDGFFVVKAADGSNLYTRAGAFSYDKNNTMVTPDNLQVMGYGINKQTGTSDGILGIIDLSKFQTIAATTTSNVSMVMNLDASQTALPIYQTASITNIGNLDKGTVKGNTVTTNGTVIDNSGATHAMTMTFTKAGYAGGTATTTLTASNSLNQFTPKNGIYTAAVDNFITGDGESVSGGSLIFQNTGYTGGTITANTSIIGRLSSSTASGGIASSPLTIYDTNGQPFQGTVSFTKGTSAGGKTTWSWSMAIDGNTATIAPNGTVTFDDATGAVSASAGTSASVTLNSLAQPLTMDFSGLSQQNLSTSISSVVDGAQGTSSWKWTAIIPGNSSTPPSGTLTFDNTGAYSGDTGSPANITINGAAPNTVAFDFSGMSLGNIASNVTTSSDGSEATSVTWNWNGTITGAGAPMSGTVVFDKQGAVQSTSGTSQTVFLNGGSQNLNISLDGLTQVSSGTTVTTTPDGSSFDPANAVKTSQFASSVQVFDSQGNAHNVNLYFRKIDTNTWNWYGVTPDATSGSLINGSLTFDSTGKLVSQTPSASTAQNITFPGGVTVPAAINFDFGSGLSTQIVGTSQVRSLKQDGSAAGKLLSTKIDDSGFINATYSNNVSQAVAQIATAKFDSVQGLEKAGNSLFKATASAGSVLVGTANNYGYKIFTNSLEQSNVDMATQLVNLIKLQRAYSGNSKTITTADDMMQETLSLKR